MHNSIETNSLLSLLSVNLFSAKRPAFTKLIRIGASCTLVAKC